MARTMLVIGEAIFWSALVFFLDGPLWACVLALMSNLLVGAVTMNQATQNQALSQEFALIGKMLERSQNNEHAAQG